MTILQLYFYKREPPHGYEYSIQVNLLENRMYTRDELISLEPTENWTGCFVLWNGNPTLNVLKADYPNPIIQEFF
jgi:hypothetical protein